MTPMPMKFSTSHGSAPSAPYRPDSGRVSGRAEERNISEMVSLEYANQKLWSVTSEYEHLLTVQKEQHDCQLKQRDLEIHSLQDQLGGRKEAYIIRMRKQWWSIWRQKTKN